MALSCEAECSKTAQRRSHRPRSSKARKLRATWASALLLVTATTGVDALFGIGEKRFKYEGLINAGSLGLDSIDGQIAAWGDWNGDQFVDAIVVDSARQTANIHTWDRTSFSFSSSPAASVQLASGNKISNVVAADVNYDGRLDLLIMSQSTSSSSKQLSMDVFLGKVDLSGFESIPLTAPSSTLAQPITFDASGDMQMDLLGIPYSDTDATELKIWRNLLANSSNTTAAFDITVAPLLDATKAPACKLANPHSSAFVDLNGDCLADLFLVCSEESLFSSKLTYQIWTAVKPDAKGNGSGFQLASTGELPPGTGALSFGDVDRDGTIDVIFPTCDRGGGNCYINVAFNHQIPLCSPRIDGFFGGGPGYGPLSLNKKRANTTPRQASASPGLQCREAEDLCVADDHFHLDFSINKDNANLLRVPIDKLTGDSRILLTDPLAPSYLALPNALHLGDYNKDGYPDLLVVTVPDKLASGGRNNAQGSGETRVHILRNLECRRVPNSEKAGLGCSPDRPEGRTFIKVTAGANALETLRDVRSASWLDIDEDGTLDILLQRTPTSSEGTNSARRITFVQNNYFHDSFFLKALTLNGACPGMCEPDNAPRFQPWGTNYGGASYKFTVLDPNGVRRAQQVGQLPQTAYRSLLTPYSYFGLGRTNNYVESLFVGSTRRQEEHYLALEGVIPNSQVVINPWQGGKGSEKEGGGPGTWTKQLYLHPGDWIPWVTVVLITTIVGLAVVVIVLHVNERREDERERKRAVHAINFDAL
ncbi:FG-GAP repeat [Kalmanozyma brasiliensis GHG001]|uniref:T-cell immunomodulatory protein TIP C2 domain-containing protein n=1 Tax=Kalmanozyma brasiliensis (strain GHG001) TaxID=1365824 RepID=V5GKU2_KALBG|nr:FG-GAP repeat [Kalmanozyma brasiliensis GHG001]EST06562.1 FG-GAP repeat [Kalmanozyma brasiliensis GHG001]